MAVFRIFEIKRTKNILANGECTITKKTTLKETITSDNQEEVIENYHKLAEKLIKEDKDVICVCLCQELFREYLNDYADTVILRCFRPRTIEELNKECVALEGIQVGNDYYYVYSSTDLAEEDEDEGIQAGLSCFYMDDESPCFQFFSFKELANRTDVCLYETEVI